MPGVVAVSHLGVRGYTPREGAMLMSSYRSVEARQCVVSWRFVVLPMLGIALLISACSTSAATSGVSKAVASPTPTSTPVPTPPPLTIGAAHPLVWRAHRLPAGIQYSSYNWAGPSLAASDSNTAYLCGISGNSVQIWATHDRAATWQKTSAVTPRSRAGSTLSGSSRSRDTPS